MGFIGLQVLGIVALFHFFDLSLNDREQGWLYTWLAGAALFTNLIFGLIVYQARQLRRARNELETNTQRLEESQRIAKIGHWEWNIRQRTLFWSPELFRIFQRTPQNFLPGYDAFLATIPPDDRELVRRAVDQALAHNTPYTIDHRITIPGGGEKIIHEKGEIIRDADGRPWKMVGTAQDITKRKHDEKELRNHLRMLALNAEIGMAMTRDSPLNETLQACCQAMVKHLDAALARIWLIPDHEAILILAASAGLHTRLDDEFSRVAIDPRTKIGDIALHRRAKISNQLLNDPQIRNPQWVQDHNLKAIAGHPLMVSGKIVGVVSFFTRYHLAESTIDSLAALADIIALGLERKQTEKRLLVQARIVDQIHDAIVTTDGEGLILTWNRGAERLFGYRFDEIKQRPLNTLLAPHEQDFFRDRVLPRVREELSHQVEIEIQSKFGQLRHADLTLSLHHGDQARTGWMICYARDITERRLSEEKIRLSGKFLEETSEAVVITDTQAKIIEVNSAFERVTGYSRREVIGENPRILKSGHHDAAFYRQMWQQLTTSGHWEGEIWSRRKNNEVYPKWLSVSAVDDKRGRTTHYVGISNDLTVIKQTREKLENLAHYDQLTGLPNRLLFHDRLQQAITRARRRNYRAALLMFDIDRFKEVNDTLGHSAGDFVLTEVAERLGGAMAEADTICRLGGDEFCVILTKVEGEIDPVIQVAQKILTIFSLPFLVEGHRMHLTPSIGISLFPDDADDPETLTKNADTAMYHTKKDGGNNFQLFQTSMFETVLSRMTLKNRLRQALEFEEFELYYQPKIAADGKSIKGAEALIRWVQPGRGPVSPAEFIPMAEESGLIIPLGEWVLREACRQSLLWQQQGLPPLRIAVNLSAIQFREPSLAATIGRILRETGLPAELLELEITESILMHDVAGAIATMQQFREMGIRLALDDFGTGYSSLGYLKRFPLNSLKIDRVFVKDISTDEDDRAVILTIITLAHSLKMEVVAEGVETADQAAFLQQQNCDSFQGYFFSRPLPAQEFAGFLRKSYS